ncbi:unnamed protein product, partial [Porites lobata]
KERNRINNEIKMAKANYYKSEVEQNVGNPKEIWRTINELTYQMSEILNDHFTSVGPNLASTLPSGNTSFDSYIKPVSTTFNLQHTSATEVLKLL